MTAPMYWAGPRGVYHLLARSAYAKPIAPHRDSLEQTRTCFAVAAFAQRSGHHAAPDTDTLKSNQWQ